MKSKFLSVILALAITLGFVTGCAVSTPDAAVPAKPADGPMCLCEPVDTSWDQPLPQPDIPPPPKDKGLKNAASLREAPCLAFKNEKEIAAEAAKPDGFVKGAGKPEDPWTIRNLAFRGITDKPAIQVEFLKRPLLIENCLIAGKPVDEFTPAGVVGINVIDSDGVVIRNCEISKCVGVYGGGSALTNMRIENCYVFSTVNGIMTSGGNHCSAVGNFVRDSTKYGVFLYNGTDHVIDGNYVIWAGREGIGTNGKSHRARYVNNVIVHNGWTAINVEGATDDTLVENNLVVDSHYGIILMGNRTICRNNRVFYSSQEGVYIHSADAEGSRLTGMLLEDNLIVGSGGNGIWVTPGALNTTIRRNRIWQSNTGVNLTAAGGVVENNDFYRFFFGISVTGHPGKIVNNHIYSGRNGMKLEQIAEAGGEVTGNRFHHSISGISAGKIEGWSITGNRLESVGQALSFGEVKNMVISGNQVYQIGYNGITLDNSSACKVEDNRLIGGVSEAIRVRDGGGHTVAKNEIANIRSESDAGGLVLEKTKDNRITGNTFRNCPVAILFTTDGSTGNTLEANVYQNDQFPVAMQRGAVKVGDTNKLDTPAADRK